MILSLFLRVKNKELQSTSKTAIFLLIVPIISTYVMLTLFAICGVAELNRTLDWMLSISAFLLLIINLLIFAMHSYNQKKSADFTELQLLLQKEADSVEYYKMLFTQMENQKILIHDIKQHLQSILILCQNRDYDKIEMNMCLQPNTPYTLLTLTNSCRKTPFIGNKLISNKKNSSQHGFGMKSIKRIVAKYSGEIKTYYSPESLTFHSIITLKNTR